MRISKSLFGSLFLIVALVICSCEQKSNSNNPSDDDVVIAEDDSSETTDPVEPEPVTPTSPPTVDIAVYTEYPEAIDGCACYFGRTAPELSEGKYIFMTNYEKKAYMMLDGEMRVFELMTSTNLENGTVTDVWSNPDYEMVVKSSETGQIDETWQQIGTINIKPTDKDATVISVVGECGC